MPMVTVKVIEGVFTQEQKQEMIRRITDTMVEIEGENLRPVTRVLVEEVRNRYVWVSGFVALGHLEIAASQQRELVMPLARRLYKDGLRADLPEFVAWALIYQAEAGDLTNLSLARTLAAGIVNPALQARVAALEDSRPRRSSSVSSWPASRCGPSAPIHRTPHHMRWMVHSESIFPNGPRCLPAASTPITRRGAGAGDVAVTVAVTRRRRASDVA